MVNRFPDFQYSPETRSLSDMIPFISDKARPPGDDDVWPASRANGEPGGKDGYGGPGGPGGPAAADGTTFGQNDKNQ